MSLTVLSSEGEGTERYEKMSNLGRKGALSSLKLDKVGGEKVTIILKGIITMKENLGILS